MLWWRHVQVAVLKLWAAVAVRYDTEVPHAI